jgi:predicted RNase H-like HicB family nuclease
MDLETLIIAVFCLVDDFVHDLCRGRRLRRRGPTPVLADSEVLPVEIVGEFLGLDTDQGLHAHFRRHFGHLFPRLREVHRTTFLRQAANLWAVKQALWRRLAAATRHDPALALIDSLPVPVCRFARAYRCRAFRGLAAFGHHPAAHQTYYGLRLHLLVAWPGVMRRRRRPTRASAGGPATCSTTRPTRPPTWSSPRSSPTPPPGRRRRRPLPALAGAPRRPGLADRRPAPRRLRLLGLRPAGDGGALAPDRAPRRHDLGRPRLPPRGVGAPPGRGRRAGRDPLAPGVPLVGEPIEMIRPSRPQTTAAVAAHYDELDPFYREVWGEHVHHGFWATGRESRTAAEAMVDLVAARLDLSPGQSVCDIGCGYGATAARLAERHGVHVTGVTVGLWHAYCPTLLTYGAATWGATREEVLGHIREMVEMIIERLAEEGASVPIAPANQEPLTGEQIVVTVSAPLEDAPHPT